MTLEKGQLIQIRKKSDSGWWEGESQVKGKKKQVGWFPASYVKALAGTGSGGSSARSTPDPKVKEEPELGNCNSKGSVHMGNYYCGFVFRNRFWFFTLT